MSRVSREQKTGVLSKRNVVVCSASATKGMFVQLRCGPVKMHVFPRESRETKVELFPHTPQFKLHIIENTFTKAIRTFSDSFSKFSSSFVPENGIEICSTSEGYN